MPPILKKKKRSFTKKLLLFLVTLIIGLGLIGFFGYKHYVYTAVDSSDSTKISFQIKTGSNVKVIAQNLKDKKIILNDYAFSIYTKLHSLDKNIVAGRFILNKTMNIPKILEIITDPSQAESIITIPEGLTMKDIDKELVELDLIKEGDFISAAKSFTDWTTYSFLDKKELSKLEIPLEGYIYPDTYFLDPESFKPEDLISLGLNNFAKKFKDLQPQIKRHTINQIITMASIIEKEVSGEKDRKLISGILWKRFENDWKLDADATLLYTKTDRKITAEDLNSDSPYNTRKVKGLPPGPICNPSIESIEAAMFPEENDYWFYLTTKDGTVIYAKTNDEQNENKAKYLGNL